MWGGVGGIPALVAKASAASPKLLLQDALKALGGIAESHAGQLVACPESLPALCSLLETGPPFAQALAAYVPSSSLSKPSDCRRRLFRHGVSEKSPQTHYNGT